MYPLNLTKPVINPMTESMGFAVANDESEHRALSATGYVPAFVDSEADPSEDDGQGHTVASARAALDEAGIAYDKRMGLAKLMALLPK